MREIKLVELIADIIYYPFALQLFKVHELEDNFDMTKICRLCYRVLTHSVQDYELNEEYVAQWIDLFFDQAMSTGEHTNIYAEPCIEAILTNNKKLLDKQITKETIDRIIDLCKKQKKNE